MNYIIFDLEWNNAYNYRTKKGINEIIEIGAVKLNSKLEIIDSFKQLIKPRLSKKLGSRFKNLTHITLEEVKMSGIDFDDAFSEFASWCGSGDNIFLSWSMSDLYTLVGNYKLFKNTANIDFMKKYADAQKYCMSFIESENANNQISLTNCAQLFDINVDDVSFHRALEDCMITAYCFRKVYDKNKFDQYVKECDYNFFERLIFKPFFISKKSYKDFNINSVQLICPSCKGQVVPINNYDFVNNTFKNAGQCAKCNKKYWVSVRAKQTYDEIVVSKRLVAINKKRAKYIKQFSHNC